MTEANEALIQIDQLTKVFYPDEVETHALPGVALSVNRGEYIAMSGPSGCGKSTLLSILGLLDTPTSGSYQLNGRAVGNLSFSERSRIRNQEIGFICRSVAGIPARYVKGNSTFSATVRRPIRRSGTRDTQDITAIAAAYFYRLARHGI
jgi:ABC-type lipoprotein export system ATPase subunit